MKKNRYMTISEFSKIAEVSRKALIFYDNIGIFSPEYTGENGYRYYSHEQIYTITVINILKELGAPLKQIKEYMKTPTPSEAVQLFETQNTILSQKIAELYEIRSMLNLKKQKLNEGICADTDTVKIMRCERKPLFISDRFDYEKKEIPDDIWLGFYMKCKENRVALGYPEGFLVSNENLISRKTSAASHIICHIGNESYANSFMPAGTYLTACGKGGFGDTEPVYEKLLNYAAEKGLSIAGDSYEERLIDEIGSPDKKQQIIKVSIQVST